MNAMFRRGAGGRRAGAPTHPLRALHAMAGCGLLLAAAWAGPAAASVLYRCSGHAGEVAYVSHTEGYRNCEKIGAWATPARRIEAAERRTEPPSRVRVSPGTPPKAVQANPAVLKVVPLGHTDAITVEKLVRPQVWQPFPVAILDALGGRVLPELLGVRAATPAASAPASVPPVAPASHPSAATPIPLKLEAAAPKPPRTGAVYRVVQQNGTVLYTNVPSLARGRDARMLFTYVIECYACDVHSKIDWNTVPLHLHAYRGDVLAASRLSGVGTALLRAVIHAESGFNPRALSYKGAQGLMQLMPRTAFELGVGDAFDPAQNISGGARYLAMLLRSYHGDVRLAAAAYNAGAAAVAKYGGVPPYAETQVYVKRVALLYRRYRKALTVQDSPALAATRDLN